MSFISKPSEPQRFQRIWSGRRPSEPENVSCSAAQIIEVLFPWGFKHQKEVILIGKNGGMIWGYHRDIITYSHPLLLKKPPFCMVPVRCGFIHRIHHAWIWQLPAAPWLSKEQTMGTGRLATELGNLSFMKKNHPEKHPQNSYARSSIKAIDHQHHSQHISSFPKKILHPFHALYGALTWASWRLPQRRRPRRRRWGNAPAAVQWSSQTWKTTQGEQKREIFSVVKTNTYVPYAIYIYICNVMFARQ